MMAIGNMAKIVGQVARPPPKANQFQNQPSCWMTMSDRFIVPASRMTLMITRPIETSYDTICAADRIAPRNGYFELEAQPPMMMPYTPSELIARM